ncbi:MAG: thiamine ABC transporter substrate binding subunit [Ostreibacterium sp.]
MKNFLLSTVVLIAFSVAGAEIAQERKTLTVYSYDSFTAKWGPGPILKKIFEKKCDCQIKFVAFEDGVTMFNRLRLEDDKTKADVIIGVDNNLLTVAEASQLFAKNNIDLSKLKLPIKWDNQTFIPYDYGQYAFIYDKTKLSNPPSSLKGLIEDQNITVIYQDPRTSTVGRGLLAWVNAVYPDNASKAWKALAKHTVTVGKGWSETYGAFLKGESDMVLSYNTSPLYHLINEKNDHYVAAEFSEGHMLQIELATRLKTSQHPKLSEQFLAFLLMPESQKAIALHNIMLPVVEVEVEKHFDTFRTAKTLALATPDKPTVKAQIKVWQKSVSQ